MNAKLEGRQGELNAKAQGREDAKAKDFPRERAELYGVANLFT